METTVSDTRCYYTMMILSYSIILYLGDVHLGSGSGFVRRNLETSREKHTNGARSFEMLAFFGLTPWSLLYCCTSFSTLLCSANGAVSTAASLLEYSVLY